MVKLSIITVNLNNRIGLIATAKSVIAQTWVNYEWIIIDGGSIDGSIDVIREYDINTGKVAFWCSEPDNGIYHGMNKGIQRAKGEYCCFLNSGDYFYKNTTLEKIFDNNFDEDIIYGDIVREYDDDNKYLYRYLLCSWKKVNIKSPFYWVTDGKSLPHSGGTLFSRKILEKTNGYDIKYKTTADKYLYMISIFKFRVSVKYIPVIIAVFVFGGISTKQESISGAKKDNKEFAKNIFPKFYGLLKMIAFFKYKLFHPSVFLRAFNLLKKIFCIISRKKYLYNNKRWGDKVL